MISTVTRKLLARFLSVGGLGFLLDVGVFQLFYSQGQGPVRSRLVSAAAAITLTWYLNRRLVFRTSQVNRSAPEYARYVTVQAAGLVINLGVYLVLLDRVSMLRQMPVLALCGGAAAAIVFNFLGARYWAFRTG